MDILYTVLCVWFYDFYEIKRTFHWTTWCTAGQDSCRQPRRHELIQGCVRSRVPALLLWHPPPNFCSASETWNSYHRYTQSCWERRSSRWLFSLILFLHREYTGSQRSTPLSFFFITSPTIGWVFKILSLTHSTENLYSFHSTWNVSLRYLVKYKFSKFALTAVT